MIVMNMKKNVLAQFAQLLCISMFAYKLYICLRKLLNYFRNNINHFFFFFLTKHTQVYLHLS